MALLYQQLLAWEGSSSLDILFWNADTTRLPAKMHKSYLKNMYINNLLAKSGRLVIRNEKIDLGMVTTPVCFVSLSKIILLWRSTLQGANLLISKTLYFDRRRARYGANPPEIKPILTEF